MSWPNNQPSSFFIISSLKMSDPTILGRIRAQGAQAPRRTLGGGSVWVVRVGGDDGELRSWRYIYVYSGVRVEPQFIQILSRGPATCLKLPRSKI